ncbi:hypothetical protein B0F90DRAFT_498003 [Multifurca ochricompacta]|uniref:Uncharacterized protein n=1 Tax=Multifurca ochricompacta TaxID=376703 RepID=A0AAD4QQS2_9AGAM|nr:hypothetical protein B0F90DRAFT_498003 [Multifurca ochricompacta]
MSPTRPSFVRSAKRQGIFDGLFPPHLTSTQTSSSTDGGLFGPIFGSITSALFPPLPSSTPTSTDSGASSSSSSAAPSSAISASSSTTSPLLTSSAVTSFTATTLFTPSTTLPPSSASVDVSTSGDSVVTLTSVTHVQASQSPTQTPTSLSFLQNTSAMIPVFTVVGIIAVIIIFTLGTFAVRKNKRNRLIKGAIDFSPTAAHLVYDDEEKRGGGGGGFLRTSDKLSHSPSTGAYAQPLGGALAPAPAPNKMQPGTSFVSAGGTHTGAPLTRIMMLLDSHSNGSGSSDRN